MKNENIGVSIIIPSKTEKFLNHTIIDVLKNATGNVEVLPVLDGYELPEEELIHDPRVRYIKLEASKSNQKRQGINKAVGIARYDYILALDAHCSMSHGYDEVLINAHQPNWVQVLQRRRLDPENWCEQDQKGKPPISYEYPMWKNLARKQSLNRDHGVHGFRWDLRTIERKDVIIDDIMLMQASMWFMSKDWFNKRGFMNPKGYGGWGGESDEIIFETLLNGGRCVVNKFGYYLHLHKGRTFGRMYKMNDKERRASYAYSYKHWVVDNREFFVNLMKRFMPIPGWPVDFEKYL